MEDKNLQEWKAKASAVLDDIKNQVEGSDVATEVDDDFKEFAEEYKFGTVILFGKNITSAEQLVNLTNSIKSTAGDIPYIIGFLSEKKNYSKSADL